MTAASGLAIGAAVLTVAVLLGLARALAGAGRRRDRVAGVQRTSTGLQEVATRDGGSIAVTALISSEVVDAGKARSAGSLAGLAADAVRAAVAEATLDDVMCRRADVEAAVVRALVPVAEPWGIRITAVEIGGVTPVRTR